MSPFQKKLWVGLLVMALLSPLGIILPELFNAGDAWGEWGTDTLEELLGYVPEGLKRYADLWRAPAPDYNLGGEGASLAAQIVSYIASGLIGVFLLGGAAYLIARFLRRRER